MLFKISTLGCKVNQYESDSISEQLTELGHTYSENDGVDICIINTCSVTQKAAMQSRQAVRQSVRANPNAIIIVTGCHVQVAQDEFLKIDQVDYIIGNSDKHRIPDILSKASTIRKTSSPNIILSENIRQNDVYHHMPIKSYITRTRPVLKIQDGCNAFCSYCIVPYTRGQSRSLDQASVIEQIDRLVKSGYKELVISGIHLGAYGADLIPKTNLLSLLKAIEQYQAQLRIRISSIEPNEISDGLINFIANSSLVCHHFHIPLQSGSDKVLFHMNRHYSVDFFSELVLKIHKNIPDSAIGVDILIGMPQETEQAFEETYSLIQKLPVTYLHVFPFSRRQGTKAALIANQIDSDTIKKRCQKMRELGLMKRKAFWQTMTGKVVETLIEKTTDSSNTLKGLTRNYIPVWIQSDENLIKSPTEVNRLVNTRLLSIKGLSGMIGKFM